jgi:hypothetical protein
MKNIILTTIILMGFSPVHAQLISWRVDPVVEWKSENLKGKVKVCKTYSQDSTTHLKQFDTHTQYFDWKGRLIDEYKLSSYGKDKYNITHCNFVDDSEVEIFKENHSPSENRSFKYFYDNQRRIIRNTEYIALTKETFIYLYTYQGRCRSERIGYRETTDSKPYNTWTYTCDSNGRIVKEEAWYTWVFEYDSRGNLARHLCPEDGSVFNHSYTYDSNNVLVESIEKHNLLDYIKTEKYDKQGNIVLYNFQSDEVSSFKEYKYIYDSVGNWIQKQEFKEGKLISTFKRTYTYY